MKEYDCVSLIARYAIAIRRISLFGDPCRLPPNDIELKESEISAYSIMERFVLTVFSWVLLRRQHRMPLEVAAFVSQESYNDQSINDKSTSTQDADIVLRIDWPFLLVVRHSFTNYWRTLANWSEVSCFTSSPAFSIASPSTTSATRAWTCNPALLHFHGLHHSPPSIQQLQPKFLEAKVARCTITGGDTNPTWHRRSCSPRHYLLC